MQEKLINQSVIQRYYNEACRPFDTLKWGPLVITGLFMGVGIGTAAYGYSGTVLNIILLIIFSYIKLAGSRLIKDSEVNKKIFVMSAWFDLYFSVLLLNCSMFMINVFNNREYVLRDIAVGNLSIVICFIALLFLLTYLYLKDKIRLDVDQIGKIERNRRFKALGSLSVFMGSLLGLTIGRLWGGNSLVLIFTCVLSAVIAQTLITLAVFYTVIYFRISKAEGEI